jgi:hypothetical protein
MKWIVDRIENNIAIIEVQQANTASIQIEIPLSALPSETKEGDIILLEISKQTTETLDEAQQRIDRLKSKFTQPTGIIDL